MLSGAATVEALRSNLTALDLDQGPDPELDAFAEEPGRYWEKRAVLAWN